MVLVEQNRVIGHQESVVGEWNHSIREQADRTAGHERMIAERILVIGHQENVVGHRNHAIRERRRG